MLEDGPRQLHGHVGAQRGRQLAPEHLVVCICTTGIPGEPTGCSHTSLLCFNRSCNTAAPAHAEIHRKYQALSN